MKQGYEKRRGITLVVAVILVFALYSGNLFRIQIASANEDKGKAVSASAVTVKASRGEIYDRNGKVLVTNSQSNSVIFDFDYFPSQNDMEKRIKIIYSLIELFEDNNAKWEDSLPIKLKNGKAVFKKGYDSSVSYLKSKDFLNLNEYATAENCLSALIERYGLEEYSKSDARKIASVCYGMKKGLFSRSAPYTFAKKVSNELVSMIKENSSFYEGVDVSVLSEREYTDGSIAPHIIGVVGAISAEEYEEKTDEGYGLNDEIGKSGIEQAMESYLRGKDGEKVVITDENGEKQTKYTTEPEKGNAVVLTIDSDIQKAVQDALDYLVNVTLRDKRSFQLVGACVVEEIATGDVLACASYPTYNLSTYWKNAGKLNTDSLSPLWNRALQSTYTPGSTMKLAVSMAGLEEGVITGDSTVTCRGRYYYYQDYQPSCMGVHGSLNVVNALYHSCNCFFYEVSRLLGIDRLNNYCNMFGLGTKTGVEIAESEGSLDSVSARSAIGEEWTPGLTLQAGIGHGNNQFTPIQLCSYVSTVASEGTRMKASFVKSVLTSDFSETVYESPEEVLSKADFKAENWALVKAGMRKVGATYFTNVDVDVCAKTGTTTVTKTINGTQIETNNGLVVCYAPAENPKIAVSVIIEGAGSGGSVCPVAEAAINAYFNKETKVAQQQNYETLQ